MVFSSDCITFDTPRLFNFVSGGSFFDISMLVSGVPASDALAKISRICFLDSESGPVRRIWFWARAWVMISVKEPVSGRDSGAVGGVADVSEVAGAGVASEVRIFLKETVKILVFWS